MDFKEKLVRLSELDKYRAGHLTVVRDTWIRELNRLYKEIENWFGEYLEQGYMSVEYRELEYAECEDFFQDTRIMELNLGGGVSVILEPTGTNVIGAFGKTDLYLRGHKDKKIFLLLIREEGEDERFHWEVWKNSKQREQILFDKEIFEKILDEWLISRLFRERQISDYDFDLKITKHDALQDTDFAETIVKSVEKYLTDLNLL